jgi:hypothetical protein
MYIYHTPVSLPIHSFIFELSSEIFIPETKIKYFIELDQ